MQLKNELIKILKTAKTPCYIIDENKLINNLQILKDVADRAGCKILLAQKRILLLYIPFNR